VVVPAPMRMGVVVVIVVVPVVVHALIFAPSPRPARGNRGDRPRTPAPPAFQIGVTHGMGARPQITSAP